MYWISKALGGYLWLVVCFIRWSWTLHYEDNLGRTGHGSRKGFNMVLPVFPRTRWHGTVEFPRLHGDKRPLGLRGASLDS